MSTSQVTALRCKDTASAGDLYMSFELGDKQWKLSIGDGRSAVSRFSLAAGDQTGVAQCILRAGRRFKTPNGAQVHSCYEAGRDGWWLHRWLTWLGVDNVVAAVALSDEFWVVCTGVFIGILALRFVAGHCIKLIEKFPVLEHTAFLLIGFVGLLLMTELTFHIDISTLSKFIGIVLIIALSIAYSRREGLKRVMQPVLGLLMLPVRLYALIIGGALGNLVDRVRYGYVVDFIDWYVGEHHWPAFNIADSAIVCGAVALVLLGWREPAK